MEHVGTTGTRRPQGSGGAPSRTPGVMLAVVLLAVLGAALPLSWYLGFLPVPLLLLGMAAVAGAASLFPSERPHLRTWAFYIGGIYLYDLLRAFADETPLAVNLFVAVDIETKLFGVAPTVWLQERLFSFGSPSVLDFLSAGIHWSFFVVPHAAAVAVYLLRPRQFARYALLIVTTFYLGLVLYFLLPTAPPWLAAEWGFLPPVARIIDFVGGQVDPVAYSRLYAALGAPNAVAAMPSVHMAVTFSVYLFCRNAHRWVARGALLYSASMAFALVYLGEHYLIDVLAGVLIALTAQYVVRWTVRMQEQRAAAKS
ncbi:MAG TPA: phosphatase PAP2 family protein [Dehalococcoidia bacterium]